MRDPWKSAQSSPLLHQDTPTWKSQRCQAFTEVHEYEIEKQNLNASHKLCQHSLLSNKLLTPTSGTHWFCEAQAKIKIKHYRGIRRTCCPCQPYEAVHSTPHSSLNQYVAYRPRLDSLRCCWPEICRPESRSRKRSRNCVARSLIRNPSASSRVASTYSRYRNPNTTHSDMIDQSPPEALTDSLCGCHNQAIRFHKKSKVELLRGYRLNAPAQEATSLNDYSIMEANPQSPLISLVRAAFNSRSQHCSQMWPN